MAEEFEDPDIAADRLEAALERVALIAAASTIRRLPEMPELPEDNLCVQDITDRLDILIGRLEAALGVNNSVLKT